MSFIKLQRILASAIAMLACMAASGAPHHGRPASSQDHSGPVIHIEDVARFYKVYDAAHRHPSAAQLQHNYIDPGSKGLHHLAKLRDVTGACIAKKIAADPAIYADARRCMRALPAVRRRLRTALGKLKRLYPSAVMVPITIAVGRGKPVGVSDASGAMIGLEALCAVKYFDPNVEDRFVHVIAHEYAHVQQTVNSPAFYDDPKPTVLKQSLLEGVAEFTAELISGSIAHVDLRARTRGHEKAIETAFVADEDKPDLSDWLYNGTLTKPGDLGYWVGYRIVKSYYQHAKDKRQALRGILQITNAKAFLAKSGWYPGIRLH